MEHSKSQKRYIRIFRLNIHHVNVKSERTRWIIWASSLIKMFLESVWANIFWQFSRKGLIIRAFMTKLSQLSFFLTIHPAVRKTARSPTSMEESEEVIIIINDSVKTEINRNRIFNMYVNYILITAIQSIYLCIIMIIWNTLSIG